MDVRYRLAGSSVLHAEPSSRHVKLFFHVPSSAPSLPSENSHGYPLAPTTPVFRYQCPQSNELSLHELESIPNDNGIITIVSRLHACAQEISVFLVLFHNFNAMIAFLDVDLFSYFTYHNLLLYYRFYFIAGSCQRSPPLFFLSFRLHHPDDSC